MLYFGSFNPPHKGHIAVAEYVLRQGLCEEVWLVVSPMSPFKQDFRMPEEEYRIQMCVLATEQSAFPNFITVCDIESALPKPSYTCRTLGVLDKLFPGVEFTILMGADNAVEIERWKDWQEIVDNYKIYVYPRDGVDESRLRDGFIYLSEAPRYDVSSSSLRERRCRGESIAEMTGYKVNMFIEENHLYEYCGTE